MLLALRLKKSKVQLKQHLNMGYELKMTGTLKQRAKT
jgi:hypothetical protein